MKIFAALIVLMTLLGCASPRGGVEHVIVIWLKEPGNVEARQKLVDTSHELAKIPGVRRVVAGAMIPSERKVVDSSFDVAVVFDFENEQAMRDYEQNPIHLRAIKEVLAPLAAKIQIYDFEKR